MSNNCSFNEVSISVIIPIKNRATLVCKTIDSILNQTLKPVEIILVDDCSTDDILGAIASYGNAVKLIKNQGTGPGAARNTGLKVCIGEFIKFFDSDDLMTPTSLYDQVDELLRSGKEFVTSPYLYAREEGHTWVCEPPLILNYAPSIKEKTLTHFMIRGLFIPIPSMLFRKSFLDKVGYWPEDVVTSEDWLYLWRMSVIEPFPAHVNTCAFIYRQHQCQSTGSNMDDLSRDKEKYNILLKVYTTHLSDGLFSWFEKKIFRLKFYQMATVTHDKIFKLKLVEAAGKGQLLFWLYFKIKMKLGRYITQTDWQPMHGAKKGLEVVDRFLESFQ